MSLNALGDHPSQVSGAMRSIGVQHDHGSGKIVREVNHQLRVSYQSLSFSFHERLAYMACMMIWQRHPDYAGRIGKCMHDAEYLFIIAANAAHCLPAAWMTPTLIALTKPAADASTHAGEDARAARRPVDRVDKYQKLSPSLLFIDNDGDKLLATHHMQHEP